MPKKVRTELEEAFIVTSSLSSEESPEGWKEASIIQLLKKLPTAILEDYRPVSLVPIAGNFFKKTVLEYLLSLEKTTF